MTRFPLSVGVLHPQREFNKLFPPKAGLVNHKDLTKGGRRPTASK